MIAASTVFQSAPVDERCRFVLIARARRGIISILRTFRFFLIFFFFFYDSVAHFPRRSYCRFRHTVGRSPSRRLLKIDERNMA